MIKRLVFDLDNTIILWKDEYTSAIKKTIKEFNIDIDYKKIDSIVEKQEIIHSIMDKKVLLYDINKECDLNLKIDFIERFLINQQDLAPSPDIDIIKTFEYLSNKYEIVLLTNYFRDTQKGRLEKIKISQYFKEIIGGDMVKLKPNKEAFLKAIGNNKPEECIMIGDNITVDIEGALKVGMNVILVDLNNKHNEEKYKTIKNLVELKNIL